MISYQGRLSERQQHRRLSPLGAFTIAVAVGSSWLYQYVAGWGLTLSFGLAFLTAAVACIGWLAISYSRPLPVPPELDGDYAKLARDGWRKARLHPWWSCQETLPHTHLVHTADRAPLVFIWRERRPWPGGHTL